MGIGVWFWANMSSKIYQIKCLLELNKIAEPVRNALTLVIEALEANELMRNDWPLLLK